MSMENMGMRSFEHREAPAQQINYAVERETCQKRLVSQAGGRQIDILSDGYLIEQINDSVIEKRDGYALLGCLTDGCERQCVVTTNQGILEEVEEGVHGRCLETIANLGRSAGQ